MCLSFRFGRIISEIWQKDQSFDRFWGFGVLNFFLCFGHNSVYIGRVRAAVYVLKRARVALHNVCLSLKFGRIISEIWAKQKKFCGGEKFEKF